MVTVVPETRGSFIIQWGEDWIERLPILAWMISFTTDDMEDRQVDCMPIMTSTLFDVYCIEYVENGGPNLWSFPNLCEFRSESAAMEFGKKRLAQNRERFEIARRNKKMAERDAKWFGEKGKEGPPGIT